MSFLTPLAKFCIFSSILNKFEEDQRQDKISQVNWIINNKTLFQRKNYINQILLSMLSYVKTQKKHRVVAQYICNTGLPLSWRSLPWFECENTDRNIPFSFVIFSYKHTYLVTRNSQLFVNCKMISNRCNSNI